MLLKSTRVATYFASLAREKDGGNGALISVIQCHARIAIRMEKDTSRCEQISYRTLLFFGNSLLKAINVTAADREYLHNKKLVSYTLLNQA